MTLTPTGGRRSLAGVLTLAAATLLLAACADLPNRPLASAPAAAAVPPPAGAGVPAGTSARPAGAESFPRVSPATQRARDSDRRRILEDELRKEEESLAAMKRDFNNGEPERRGDERNFAKYQERVAEMRAAITRKEADIAAIRRELAKLPS